MDKLTAPITLKDHAKFRIMSEMMEMVKKNSETPMEMYPLIVDDESLKIFSSVFTLKELPELRISRVEKIQLKRKCMPNSEGVYMLSPTTESVDRLLADYSDPKKPQFARAHLCFLNMTPDNIIDQIAQSEVARRVKTFLDVNLEMQCFEENVFFFDTVNNMKLFYTDSQPLTSSIVEKLFTVCTTLYEYPSIIFYNKSQLCKYVAQHLDARLNDFDKKSTYRKHMPKGQLIILDRSIDMCSSIMHDYTFMPIAYDMNPKKDLKTLLIDGKEGINIDCNNNIWENEKYSHIYDANFNIAKMAEQFADKNKKIAGQASEKVDEVKLADLLQGMPEYQNISRKLPIMVKLTNLSTKLYAMRGMREVIVLEQCIINGIDENGTPVAPKKLFTSVKEAKTTFPSITEEEICRLIIILLSRYYVGAKDFSMLMDLLPTPKYKECINNCKNLKLIKCDEKSELKRKENTAVTSLETNLFNEKNKKYPHKKQILAIPEVTKAILNAAERKYDACFSFMGKDEGEGLKFMPQKSAAVTKLRPKLKKIDDNLIRDDTERIIVFMIGGMTTHEIAYTYYLQKNGFIRNNIIMGSNSLCTPSDLLESIIACSSGDLKEQDVKLDMK